MALADRPYIFAAFFLILIAMIHMTLCIPSAHAQDSREFMLPTGLITDFSGTLSEDDIDTIRHTLESAHRKSKMDGHVIIALRTQEWYLEEYAKDYADFLQGRGIISSTGWLLYISTADRKFTLVVQNAANESITGVHKREVALILNEKIGQDDMVGGIIDAVNALGDLPAPEVVREKKKISPDMTIFIGILIIVIVLMLRLRKGFSKSTSNR